VIYASVSGAQAPCRGAGSRHRRYTAATSGSWRTGRSALLIALDVGRLLCAAPVCKAVTFAERAEGLSARRLWAPCRCGKCWSASGC
jgi:hypothetical protein